MWYSGSGSPSPCFFFWSRARLSLCDSNKDKFFWRLVAHYAGLDDLYLDAFTPDFCPKIFDQSHSMSNIGVLASGTVMGEIPSRFLQARITRRWMFCQGDVQLVCWRRAKQEEGWTFISTMGQPAFRRDCYICDLGDFLYCVRNKKPSLVCLGVQRIRRWC